MSRHDLGTPLAEGLRHCPQTAMSPVKFGHDPSLYSQLSNKWPKTYLKSTWLFPKPCNSSVVVVFSTNVSLALLLKSTFWVSSTRSLHLLRMKWPEMTNQTNIFAIIIRSASVEFVYTLCGQIFKGTHEKNSVESGWILKAFQTAALLQW